ncbi:MAG: hypothetical protein Q9192_004808 [Flavoplaca navasiana]
MEAPTEPSNENVNSKVPDTDTTTSLLSQYDNVYFGDHPMVQLKVGAEEKTFYVHKGLICESSPFFRAAFTGGFKENSGSITLEEDDPDIFGHIVQWLYRGKLDTLSKVEVDTGSDYWMKLFQLYVLADKYGIRLPKNAVMGLLLQTHDRRKNSKETETHRPPEQNCITYVYENTASGSQLRRFLVTYYVWHINLEWFSESSTTEWLENIPAFGAELTKAFASRAMGASSPFNDRSSFNESIRD